MAQAQPEREIHQETPQIDTKNENNKETITSSSSNFKFNAQAPEFVPRSHTHMPISGYYYPCFHYLDGNGGSDWIYVGDQELVPLVSNPNMALPNGSKDVLTDDLKRKIIKQVEYQFSDMSLLANESLVKHINKDPEGYVPLSAIASAKKIKSLLNNNQLLAQALRSSSKLVVSNDGKKIRRKHPFTDKEKEELQSRIVVAENLPEDHSYPNLSKIFSMVGSVKTIRVCHPQDYNSSRSKVDFVVSNKLHALVQYETTEIAEKAVDKLNDERNWRKGLRVRLLLRRSPKSVLKSRKSDFDSYLDDDEVPFALSEDSCQPNNSELVTDTTGEENSVGGKKGGGRGHGKSRLRRIQSNSNGRSLLAPSPQPSSSIQSEAYANKQATKGPRMPDGTKGFTMGRGKPITTQLLPTSPVE